MKIIAPRSAGFSMIEVLVTLVIMLVGMLGFAGVLVQGQRVEMESYQRSQALMLVQDLAHRINANRANAGQYPIASPFGTGSVYSYVDCSALAGTERDFCEFDRQLKGASEILSGNSVGGLIGARGCVELLDGATSTYMITIAWQGLAPTSAPPGTVGCGAGQYGDEKMRRVVTTVIRIGNLL